MQKIAKPSLEKERFGCFGGRKMQGISRVKIAPWKNKKGGKKKAGKKIIKKGSYFYELS